MPGIKCVNGHSVHVHTLDLLLLEMADLTVPPCSIMRECWRMSGIKRVKGIAVHTLDLLLLEMADLTVPPCSILQEC